MSTPKNVSDYVLARRINPALMDDADRERLAKAQAKRERQAERRLVKLKGG